MLDIFKSCFSDEFVLEIEGIISKEDYRQNRRDARKIHIQNKMEKVAVHFIHLARIASKKNAVKASKTFTLVAEAHSTGGQGSVDSRVIGITVDRKLALNTLDDTMDDYLLAFEKEQQEKDDIHNWFMDNQQSKQNTTEQRVDRRSEGTVKVTSFHIIFPFYF